MTRKEVSKTRGFFAVGVYHPKTEANVGSLYRTAHLYGAAYMFTIGKRYTLQASDTPKAQLHTPLFHFTTIEDAISHLPFSTPLVAVELDERSVALPEFVHPERAAYLMGAEDHGLPTKVLDLAHHVVQIPSVLPESMNVAVAGSLMVYDRFTKRR